MISFYGDDVRKTLTDNYDVVRAIWAACATLIDATIKIHVFPRVVDSQPLEWSMNISSPVGRKTVTVTQRVPAGGVLFTDK